MGRGTDERQPRLQILHHLLRHQHRAEVVALRATASWKRVLLVAGRMGYGVIGDVPRVFGTLALGSLFCRVAASSEKRDGRGPYARSPTDGQRTRQQVRKSLVDRATCRNWF